MTLKAWRHIQDALGGTIQELLLVGNIAPPSEAEGCGAPWNIREQPETAAGNGSKEERRQSPASNPRPTAKRGAALNPPALFRAADP